MFAAFYHLLRAGGVDVSIREFLTLQEALRKGLHHSSLTEFYYLARAVLIKSEADFDAYDRAFLEFFRNVKPIEFLPKELEDWLSSPLSRDEERELFDRLLSSGELEDLRKMLEERLAEQTERHDGGSKWIGTGGTSPFGHSGFHPGGIRIGGEGKHRSAAQIAGERQFRDFREDDTLEMRQFQLAFRRLRRLGASDEGPRDELLLDETIRATGDNAGNLTLVYGRPRKNQTRLLLLFDSGGSMWPYSRLCATLFQAVHDAQHFRELRTYFFHNIFYDRLYRTPACAEKDSDAAEKVLAELPSDTRVIVVGDASMAPSELFSPGGNIYWWHSRSNEAGTVYLDRMRRHFPHMVWLNPLPPAYWDRGYGSETIRYIKDQVPMFPLTVQGLEQAAACLAKDRRRAV